MHITVGELEVDAAPGVCVRELVQFAHAHRVAIDERPWCGPVRLLPEHRVGQPPLLAFARLASAPGPDARPRPGAHLAVVGGPDSGAVATLADGLTVGRGSEASLRLRDPSVSALHAVVVDGRVRDAGSRNGTRVNGRRSRRRARLHDGDTLQLGDSVIAVSGAPARNPAPRTPLPRGLASGATAGLTMAAFAVMSGHWPLAIIAFGAPLAVAAVRPRRADAPGPVLDVTATLGLPALPHGAVAVRGSRGLMRAVTIATGRPPPSARQWEEWMTLLPPADRDVTWLRTGEEAPSWAQVLVSANGAHVEVAANGTTQRGPLPLVRRTTAEASARRIAARDEAHDLPAVVRWGELPRPRPGGLTVRLGVGARGPVVLDLVADGPHVLVAGTTGSGKSEALRTIVASLAHDYAPADLSLALIDFKGGAGLGPCAALPHVGSVLTDLQPHLARRCLLALAAELADRKRAAAAAGATTFDEWQGQRPPRLVVVVDEFQEIAGADREFLPQLARLAAQGRSLGIHLVLATQRPAGAVGADIRANISTTLALRTASEAESLDLLGAPDAAVIARETPGRAVLARAGTLEPVQVALPLADVPPPIRLLGEPPADGEGLVTAAAAKHAGRARPLWLPPLPTNIAPSARDGWVLGIADVPERRVREPLVWDPAAGPLVVTGPPRSGRSSALRCAAAIAERVGLRVAWLPDSPRLAVRTLALALDAPDSMLVVDDAARTLALAATADAEVMDLITAAMRVMPVALAAPAGWAAHRLTAAAGLRLVFAGMAEQDEAAWDVPRHLRGLPLLPGRVRASSAQGWREAQLSLPGMWAPTPLVRELPPVCPPLPAGALGIGGDDARAVRLPSLPAVVIGMPGAERDAIAQRVAAVTGLPPSVAESAFTAPPASIVVVVRATHRALREALRDPPRGLVDPHPPPLRSVVVIDGAPVAVQVCTSSATPQRG